VQGAYGLRCVLYWSNMADTIVMDKKWLNLNLCPSIYKRVLKGLKTYLQIFRIVDYFIPALENGPFFFSKLFAVVHPARCIRITVMGFLKLCLI